MDKAILELYKKVKNGRAHDVPDITNAQLGSILALVITMEGALESMQDRLDKIERNMYHSGM